MPRVLLAGLFHEGNSFSSVTTGRENFSVTRGDAVLEKARNSGAAMGGACRYLMDKDVTLVPVITAIAPPGGPVSDQAYREFRDVIVATARAENADGIYLDLHGAMLTQEIDDVEGDLLRHLRSVLGPDVPISVSLDLHAYVTSSMLNATPLIVACKENPHSDYHLAGELAARLLMRKLGRDIQPTAAALWLPLIFGSQMETGQGPLARLHAARRELLERFPQLLDISIYNGTSFMDVPGNGQHITAIADGDGEVAERAVRQLGQMLWDMRDAFVPDLPDLEEIISTLQAGGGKPVILGDQGDRVLAGSPGDGTYIISQLLEKWPDLRALVPITDPAVVAAAKRAGISGTVDTPVGGGLTRNIEPVLREWTVTGLGDGHFVQQGPFLANEAAELGETATLKCGNLVLLVTAMPGFTQDPQAFRSQGLEPGDFDIVVTKSGYHFKLAFADIGPCISIDSPGTSNYRPGYLPYRKLQSVYPENRDVVPEFAVWRFTA